jgi:DNA polymerase-3 subunit beta
VPSKILGELVKFIKSAGINGKTDVTVGLSVNQIGFKIEKTVFISRLIEGNFPAYEQIIPKTKEMTVEINAEKLLAVTKRAAICANERNGSVKYLFKKGVLFVNSESQNMNFEDEVDIDYTGKDFQVNFNPRFVMDIFKISGEKNIVMEFSTPATPALMRIAGSDAFVYIVMPLRTQ